MKYHVTDFLPQSEILAQLAEESAELAHAALKMRRVLDGENPTPVGYAQALKDLNEEIADVTLCIEQLSCVDHSKVNRIFGEKLNRWIDRLCEARRQEDSRKEQTVAGSYERGSGA